MTQPTREEAFDALLREAAAWRLRQALAALPSEECLRAEYGPLHRLDRRVRRSVRALRLAVRSRTSTYSSRVFSTNAGFSSLDSSWVATPTAREASVT